MPDSFMIAVVEDDDAVRASTALLFRSEGHRVECFTSGTELLASDLPPRLDCILLDMAMPGKPGLEVMQALRDRGDTHPVIVLTGHGDIKMAVAAMRLGAVDFLEKPCPPEELLKAILRTCTRVVVAPGQPPANRLAQEKVAALSPRERELLAGIMAGKSNKILAFETGLSIRTVEAYRAQMFGKLGVKGTAQAIKLGLAAGLSEG